MTVLPVLLTAAEATKLTEASRSRTDVRFDPTVFESMRFVWDRHIRDAAEAGDRSISIASQYGSSNEEALQAFGDHFTGLGYHVTFESFLVSSFPAFRERRLKAVVSWQTETKP